MSTSIVAEPQLPAPAPALHARLLGTPRQPSLLLSFPPRATHPSTHQQLISWVKSLPGARFDPTSAAWLVTGTGPTPTATLTGAGFTITGLGDGEFADVYTLDQMVTPVSLFSEDRRTVLVRHRLLGFDGCRERIGPAALWDGERKLFRVPVSDVLVAGVPRHGVLWDPAAVDAAYALRDTSPLVPGLEAAATRLCIAPSRHSVEADVRAVAEVVGHSRRGGGCRRCRTRSPGPSPSPPVTPCSPTNLASGRPSRASSRRRSTGRNVCSSRARRRSQRTGGARWSRPALLPRIRSSLCRQAARCRASTTRR